MDWLYVLMPIAGVKIFWPGLIILGIGVGIIGGFFGMGGAWMVTPGLNILGFPDGLCHRHRHRPHGRQIAHFHHAPRQVRQRGLQTRLHHARRHGGRF